MVQLQIHSDLHLELSSNGYKSCEIPKTAPNLVLAGDIGRPADPKFFQEFLIRLLDKWERVFYVPGNHEHWESSISASEQFCGSFEAQVKAYRTSIIDDGDVPDMGEFIFLNRKAYHFPNNPDGSPGPTLLGCTLWSSMADTSPEVRQELDQFFPDFSFIKDWTTEACHQRHLMERGWLEGEVEKLRKRGRKGCIVTHHGPLARGCSAPHLDGSRHSSAFNTDMGSLSLWDASVLSTWIFGHTHWSVDFVHEGVRVVANQKGYRGEVTHYEKEGKIIEI